LAFKFEKLIIWQLAIEASERIFKIYKTFPKEEMFALNSQMNRAVNSISLNIVEGSTGQSDAEQKRFLIYANRSALEVVNCLYIAKKRNYINEEVFAEEYIYLENLIIKIQAFINKLK
jgi:four helix bundle protein